MAVKWDYSSGTNPPAEEVTKEISGRALVDIKDPKTGAVLFKAGEQLPGFGVLRDDGTTECGNWIYGGCWSQVGNLTARRNNADEGGMGNHLSWGYSWPANRRVLYNRAGADPSGKAWDPKRPGIQWDGTKWAGIDVPDIAPALGPSAIAGAKNLPTPSGFMMNGPAPVEGPRAGAMSGTSIPAHFVPSHWIPGRFGSQALPDGSAPARL